MTRPYRYLIVTAAFGEGHNSAARNLARALEAAGAACEVRDPCLDASPRATRLLGEAYRWATTHAPRAWAAVYRSTDRCDFRRPRIPMLRAPERLLAETVERLRPDAVISTYPLYPYFLERHFARGGWRCPVFTVVTDSIEINAAWLRAPTDHFFVTDRITRRALVDFGLAAEAVSATGFPVHLEFARLATVAEGDACAPFRILYFPTAKLPHVRRHARALLDAAPEVELTMILGRNARKLLPRALEIRREYPGRVRLTGWTRRVPWHLGRHHLVVGKAGGATVHEAIAARCPMLIHHLVPGQEEGNLALLEKISGGQLAPDPASLTAAVRSLLAEDGRRWREMKRALAVEGPNDGALATARRILELTASTSPSPS
jgi:processive 1,2-diacylglycerol beta-glucosyltransferase